MKTIKNLLKIKTGNNFDTFYPEYNPNDGKIHVLYMSMLGNGTGLYRTILPYLHLNETNTHSAILHQGKSNNTGYYNQSNPIDGNIDERIIKWADFVVFPTVTSDLRPIIKKYREQNPKIVFVMDIDDNPEVIPVNHPNIKMYTNESKQNLIRNMGYCDLVTCSNTNLQKYYSDKLAKKNTQFEVFYNVLSKYLTDDMDEYPAKIEKKDGITRILLTINAGHYNCGIAFSKVLKNINKKYKDTVELVNFGWNGGNGIYRNAFDGVKIDCLPGVSFLDYYKMLHCINPDISIIPLRSTEFNRYKSFQRYLEYSLFSIPTIVGESEVYKDIVSDYENSVVCIGNQDFMENIDILIENATIREKISENANIYCNENFSYKNPDHIEKLKKIFLK